MKRIALNIAVSIACCLCTVTLYAQENEGLIPKLMKKWKGGAKEGAQVPAKQPAVKSKAPVPVPKQVLPARPPEGSKTPAAPSETQGERTVVTGVDKMTKAELLKEITETLDSEDEILDYLPQLKKETSADGKNVYKFSADNKSVPIQDLDEGTLKKILGSVHQTSTRINTDRITRQLEVIRQTQRVVSAPTPPRPAPVTPPAAPPRVVVPQITHSPAPQQPPQTSVPRTPAPPPQLPRR